MAGVQAPPALSTAVDHVLDWAGQRDLATPSCLLALEAARAGVARLRAELPDVRISYATKANALPRFLQVLAPLVDDFNVTNLAHLDALTTLGVDPARIQFLHPVVTAATVEAVLARDVSRFVVDDPRGVGLLARTGRPLAVTVRIRPPSLGESGRSVVRFGAEPGDAVDLARALSDAGHVVEGLAYFVGTAKDDTDATAPHRCGIASVCAVLEQVDAAGIAVGGINIGGGFPGARRRFHAEHPEFFPVLAAELRARLGTDRGITCEPGRYLAEPSGLILASVVADRRCGHRRLVHLDVSGFAGLFETSFIDPGSGPEVHAVPGAGGADGDGPATVVGPVMDSFDVLARQVHLPPLAEGERVLVPNVGAYTWGYSTTTEGVGQPAVVELPEDIDREIGALWHA